jgi:hypothetical protein
MIFVTQLIYVIPGKEEIFHQFEEIAIPIIYKYKGQLQLRVRPGKNAIVEHHIDPPYEIHLVSFETENDFHSFMRDEDRKQFLHLKEQSIRASVLIQGVQL